jgi:hypothetical protein
MVVASPCVTCTGSGRYFAGKYSLEAKVGVEEQQRHDRSKSEPDASHENLDFAKY